MDKLLKELDEINLTLKDKGNTEDLLKEKLRIIVKITNELNFNESEAYIQEGYNTSKLLFENAKTDNNEITMNFWAWNMLNFIEDKEERKHAREQFLNKYEKRAFESSSISIKYDFAKYYENFVSLLRGRNKYPLWKGNGVEKYSYKLCKIREKIYDETKDAHDKYKLAETYLLNAECNCPSGRDVTEYTNCINSLEKALEIIGDTPEKGKEEWYYYLKGSVLDELGKKIIDDLEFTNNVEMFYRAYNLLQLSYDYFNKLYALNPNDHHILIELAEISHKLAKISKEMRNFENYDLFSERSLQEYERYHTLTGKEYIVPFRHYVEDFVNSLVRRGDYHKSVAIQKKYGDPYDSGRFLIESLDNGRFTNPDDIIQYEKDAINYLLEVKDSDYIENRFKNETCWPEKYAELYYLLGDLYVRNNETDLADSYYDKAEQMMHKITLA